MKTLHITNAYHPPSGGIRTLYHALQQYADADGRRMVLVVPGEATTCRPAGRFGRVYTIAAPPSPVFDRRYRLVLPHQYLPFAGGALAGVLEREQPDVVEICDKYSLPYLAATLRKGWHRRVGRPALIGLSCERFDDNVRVHASASAGAMAMARRYVRHIYGSPFDCHVAVSRYAAEELRSALHDRPSGVVRVCSPGVDVARFRPERRSLALRRRLLAEAGGHAWSTLLQVHQVVLGGRAGPTRCERTSLMARTWR